jgi:XTP/dITP diphosphohydrolase
VSRILLATRSEHKATEIRSILALRRDLQLVTLRDLDLPESPDEDAIENAPTFLENALAKARHFEQRSGLPTIADDSGLEVAALGNAPGVRTRRFATDAGRTELTGDALDRANNELLLEKLHDVPQKERAARYVCTAAFFHEGKLLTAIGTCSGEIALEPRGRGGFGYDPIFFLPELGITFAQLARDQKNLISHRARAFRALAVLLTGSVDLNPRRR